MSFTHFSLGLGNKGTSGQIVGLAMNETLVSQEKKTVRKVFPTSSKVDVQVFNDRLFFSNSF